MRGGGELLFIAMAINFSTMDQMSKILWFSESLENFLSNDGVSIQKFVGAKISHFSALDHGLFIIHWYRQIGKYFYRSNKKFDDTILKVSF